MSPLDMAEVRSSFPALSQDQVYLDNAGGSQTLGTVIDSCVSYPPPGWYTYTWKG